MNSNFYYTFNGFIIHDLSEIPINGIAQKHFRLCGGKGGFGSMLRAIGSQIEKTTNREMCRDLNGRRMRDVNNEKRLKEWIDNADSREREKLESYLEKRRKRKLLLDQGPSAKMPYEDRSVEEQRKQIAEELQDAICEAFENRKETESRLINVNAKPKKNILDFDSDSDSSSCSSSGSPRSINTGNADCSSVPVESVGSGKLPRSELVDNLELPESTELTVESVISTEKSIENVVKTEKPIENVLKQIETVKEISFANIDLDSVGSVTHLLTYGADWIKNDLMRRGLKSGGTLMERAQRLFSVKGLTEYPANLLIGAVRSKRK